MTSRHPKYRPASEIVREAIRASGLPIRELARRTGVEVSALSRFMNEQVGISLTTFEKLAPELGLRVVQNTAHLGSTGKSGRDVLLPPITARTTTGRKAKRSSRTSPSWSGSSPPQ